MHTHTSHTTQWHTNLLTHMHMHTRMHIATYHSRMHIVFGSQGLMQLEYDEKLIPEVGHICIYLESIMYSWKSGSELNLTIWRFAL